MSTKKKVQVEQLKPAERKITLAYLDRETQENQALFVKAREHNASIRRTIASEMEELSKLDVALSRTFTGRKRQGRV